MEAIAAFDTDIAAGELVAIIGPSGCGKSTLLRILAGLTVPTRGIARVGDTEANGRPGSRRVPAAARPAAPVAARRSATPRSAPRSPASRATRPAGRRPRAFARFGLDGFARAWPSSLSGGMRQRVALLRTFLVPRPVLLLDEPFGALDAITRRTMQEWLQEVWMADGRTVLLVTHDVEEALLLADRVIVMSSRPGRIVDDLGVAFPRPRATDLVTEPDFVAAKRRLLDALAT